MAKINRFSGNLKAFGSSATGTERTVFGDISQSDTLDDNINSDFLIGWENGVDINGFPPRQYFNAVTFTATQLAAYLHQMGIAEYDALQEYHTGSLVNVSGIPYVSKTDTNTGNDPVTDKTNWRSMVNVLFDFVADMVLSTELEIGMIVTVNDYADQHNSGQLMFEIVDAATGTDDGGSFIDLSGSGFQAQQVFPGQYSSKMWGIKGDGVADDSVALQSAIDYLEVNVPGGLLYCPDHIKFSGVTNSKQISLIGNTSGTTIFTNATNGGTMLSLTYDTVNDLNKRNVIRFDDIQWLDTGTETGRAVLSTDVLFLEFNRNYWQNFSTVRAVQLDETLWVVFNFCSTNRAEVRVKSILDPHNSNVVTFNGGEYRNPTTNAIDIDTADVVMLNGVTVEGDSGETTSPTRGLTFNAVRMLTITGMYMEVLRTGDSGMKLIDCGEVAIKRSLLGSGSSDVPAVHLTDTSNMTIEECASSTFFLRTDGDIQNIKVKRCTLEGRIDIADGNDVEFSEIHPAGPVIIPVNPSYQSTMQMDSVDNGIALKNNYASSSFKQLDPTGTVSGTAAASYKTDGGYLDDYSLQLDFTGVQQAVFAAMGTTDEADQGAIITFMAKADIDTDFGFIGSIFSAIGGDVINVTTGWRRYFLFTSLGSAISGTSINLIIDSTETSQLLIDDIQTIGYSSLADAARAFANFRHIQTFGSAKTSLDTKDQRETNFLILPKDDAVTISGGVITVDASSVIVDTESSDVTDNLDTINGVPDGGIIFVRAASSGRTVILKDGIGNLNLSADITLDNVTDVAALVNIGGFLREFSSSNNAA